MSSARQRRWRRLAVPRLVVSTSDGLARPSATAAHAMAAQCQTPGARPWERRVGPRAADCRRQSHPGATFLPGQPDRGVARVVHPMGWCPLTGKLHLAA